VDDDIRHLLALFGQGRLRELVDEAQALEARYADSAIFHNILGAAYAGLRRWDDALAHYGRALAIKPDYAEAHNNLGVALNDTGARDEAAAHLRRALEIRPDYAEAHNNLGVTLNNIGAVDEAVASYRRALELKPDYAEAHNNLGAVLWRMGALNQAAASFRRALEIQPDNAEAHNNLGSALMNQEAWAEAAASFRRAVEIRPDFFEAHSNLGAVLKKMGALDEAVASYRRVLEIRPENAEARAQKLFEQAHMCDWGAIEEDVAFVSKLGVAGDAVSPFAMLALEDNPARHRVRSEMRASARYRSTPLAAIPRPQVAPRRLRVGYFSADFHNHATMYLMARLFEVHDRAGFEIFAYSYGPERQDEMWKRLVEAVDGFEDVRQMSDEAVARLARTHALDIAVDLKGFTSDTRSGIFAFRAAPIQISYLGYPGTMGAPFIDYLIADETVIPEAQRAHYSESILYLPNSYQVNDDSREIAADTPARAAFGLPEGAFVFCCFNSVYKIGPAEFDVWMRLLRQVEGSVLWLRKANGWAERNLKKEAEARGVDGARLVFADRLPSAEHLARHRHADLFLDTFTYNAHTTASDALWAGLPVITVPGRGFPARVGASLLNAVGLPGLIAATREEYERLALELATNPGRLRAVRQELRDNRKASPLFDTALFARHIEDAFRQAYQRYFDGEPPATVRVMPQRSGGGRKGLYRGRNRNRPFAARGRWYIGPGLGWPLSAKLRKAGSRGVSRNDQTDQERRVQPAGRSFGVRVHGLREGLGRQTGKRRRLFRFLAGQAAPGRAPEKGPVHRWRLEPGAGVPVLL